MYSRASASQSKASWCATREAPSRTRVTYVVASDTFDQRRAVGDVRRNPGQMRLEDRTLCPAGIIFGGLRDLFEDLAAARIVEPFGREALGRPLQPVKRIRVKGFVGDPLCVRVHGGPCPVR